MTIARSIASPLTPPAVRGGPRPAPAGPAATRRRPVIGLAGAAAIALPLLVIVVAAFLVSLPVAGVLYAVWIIAVTLVRPDLTLMVVFLETPLLYDLSGDGPFKMAAADITLVLATPVLLLRFMGSNRRVARSPIKWPLAAYLLVCLASATVNGFTKEAVTSTLQMVLYTVWIPFIFANCIRDASDIYPALYGLVFADCALALAVLILRSGYAGGLHKNAVGSELGFAVVIAVELWLGMAARGRWRWVAAGVALLLAGALFYTLSRGAWLGAAVGLLVLFLLRGRVGLAVRSVVVIAPVLTACWMMLPKVSQDYTVDFSHSAYNIEARRIEISMAYNWFRDNPVLGVGVGLRKVFDATNVVMATMAETGALGLVAFLAIFAAFFRMVWRTRRRLAQTDPAFSLMAIGAALMASEFVHGCVDHYWSRVMLPVWASAGLAVFAYNHSLGRDAARTGGPAAGAAAAGRRPVARSAPTLGPPRRGPSLPRL